MKEFRVLMVDDEEDFVTTLSERMKLRDVDSQVALDGEQALQRVEEDIPDVMYWTSRCQVLMDWRCFGE